MFDVSQEANRIQSRLVIRRLAALAEQQLVRAELQLASRRLEALDSFIGACESAGALLDASDIELARADAPRLQRKSYGDVRRAVEAALCAAPPNGLPLAEIVQQVANRLGKPVAQKSPATTLTRLKARGLVENTDFRWRLTEAGRKQLAITRA